jgi:hypothetical protein
MKKNLSLLRISITAFLLAVFFVSCEGFIREFIPPEKDKYMSFPEAEILGASFYYQRDGKDVTGNEAGMISKNEDGTYKIRMKRRSPSNVPTAMYIMGSFEFSEYYKMICTFPDDPAVTDKPYRVYVVASRYQDLATDAHYPSATSLIGQSVFRNGYAAGTFEMTNEGTAKIPPDRNGRPYTTLFIYLYFNSVSDPDDYYEFQMDFAGGANGIIPVSKVTRAEIYREGDTANKFILEPKEETTYDPFWGSQTKIVPILARFNHRFDTLAIAPAVPVIDIHAIHADLQVPDADAGKEIEFEVRNIGLFGVGNNMITRDMLMSAKVLAGTGAGQNEQTGMVTEVTVNSTPVSYYYKVKAKIVQYPEFTGIKMLIPGTTETFTGTKRLTFTINVPDKYVGE